MKINLLCAVINSLVISLNSNFNVHKMSANKMNSSNCAQICIFHVLNILTKERKVGQIHFSMCVSENWIMSANKIKPLDYARMCNIFDVLKC